MRQIDADALIMVIRDAHILSGASKAMMMDIVMKAPTVGGWISVEDRLPEDECFVLVCNDDGKMMVAQYIAETDKWQYRYMAYDVDVWDDTEQGPVEWWMPLLEAPEGERGT